MGNYLILTIQYFMSVQYIPPTDIYHCHFFH